MSGTEARRTGVERPLRSKILISLLLALALSHAVLSSFEVNFSYLDLIAYEHGTERNPFQERIAMAWLLQRAHDSAFVRHAAAEVQKTAALHPHSAFKGMTPEIFTSIVSALVTGYLLLGVMNWWGLKRFGKLWWLPSVLLVAMLSVTIGARYENNVWYPYDLPHMALFGSACLFLMEGWWALAFLFFLADIPVRETSIFLAGLVMLVAYARREFKTAVLVPAAMLAVWVPFRMYVHHLFPNNPTEAWMKFHTMLAVLTNPIHWPQFASAFGFMVVPLILYRSYLTRPQRFFMLGAVPCLVVIMLFGIWTETRIFLEWYPAAAMLLAVECSNYLGLRQQVEVQS